MFTDIIYAIAFTIVIIGFVSLELFSVPVSLFIGFAFFMVFAAFVVNKQLNNEDNF